MALPQSDAMNPVRIRWFPAPPGEWSMLSKLTGQSGLLNGKSIKLAPLGFPRGEAGSLDGFSEPARLTDEG